MKVIGIYKITSPSGKVYIGQSWDIVARWYQYRYLGIKARQTHLLHSFMKHGMDNHVFEVIHELPPDVEQSVMDDYEQLYMDIYRSAGIVLLNSREAGKSGRLSDDAKRNISKGLTGRKFTEKTRAKISAANSRRILSDETKEKIGSANRGKVRTEEQKLKNGRAGKGKKKPEGFGEKVSERFKGIPKTPEHRLALSEARKSKGLAAGVNNPKAKLTAAIVREIRAKHAAGATLSDLFRGYKMSKSGMHSILTGKNWPGF